MTNTRMPSNTSHQSTSSSLSSSHSSSHRYRFVHSSLHQKESSSSTQPSGADGLYLPEHCFIREQLLYHLLQFYTIFLLRRNFRLFFDYKTDIRPDFTMWGLKDNDFILSSCITNTQKPGIIVNYFELNKGFTKEMITLNTGSQRVMNTPNAGGNSVWSEVVSFEVLSFLCSAVLHRTEMEIEYAPGSKITDYSVKVFGKDLGVSVTRAMKFSKNGDCLFTEEDAFKLLSKKLHGVNESTKGVVSSSLFFSYKLCI